MDNLKLYMANEQCKHIFFAAAESPRYHRVLEPYRNQTSKITLVFGSGLDSGLRKLSLLLVSFPKVFSAPPGTKVHAGNATGLNTTINKGVIKGDAVGSHTLLTTSY